MIKLLNGEFHRLLHFKLYFIECAAVMLFSAYMMFTNYPEHPAVDGFLFRIMALIGYLSSIYVSQFIGTEYSCGTFRNKMFIGHTRTEIYFTQLILQFFATLNLLNISILTVVILGAIRRWQYDFSFATLFYCYLMCVCTIFFITAISVFVSMLNSSNMASFIILLTLVLGLQMFGGNFTVKLKEPEIRMPYDYEIAEGQTEPIKNDLYASGSERALYEYLVVMNPYAHANYEFEPMYDRYIEYERSKIMEYPLVKIFLFSAVESTLLILVGISAFNRKQIK